MSALNTSLTLAMALAIGAAWPVAASEPAGDAQAPTIKANIDADIAPLNCVSLARIKHTRILDDQNILFEMNGKKTLINHLPRRCPSLGFEKRFGYTTRLSQLCNTDMIWVITDIGRGVSCGLGMFEPYVQPETVTVPNNGEILQPE